MASLKFIPPNGLASLLCRVFYTAYVRSRSFQAKSRQARQPVWKRIFYKTNYKARSRLRVCLLRRTAQLPTETTF